MNQTPTIVKVTLARPINFIYYCLFLSVILACIFFESNYFHTLETYLLILLVWPRYFTKNFIIFTLFDYLIVQTIVSLFPNSLYFCVKILAIVRPLLFKKFVKITALKQRFQQLE